jgi:hypothetical protein
MRNIALVVLSIFITVGCNSNPYPKDAKFAKDKPVAPVEKPESKKVYDLSAPYSVSCVENILCTFQVQFSVRNDLAVLSFENLPPTANVNLRTGAVSWLPTHADANGQIYVVLVDLRGSNDSDIMRQRSTVLTVKANAP